MDRKTGPAEGQRAQMLERAARLCAERGGRLTGPRRQVLAAMAHADGPLGAYDIMRLIEVAEGRVVNAPTVYRALDFLRELGIVARIESRNTFLLCNHPEVDHDHLFVLCRECGATRELQSPSLEQELSKAAESLDFQVDRRIVELEGICTACHAQPKTGPEER